MKKQVFAGIITVCSLLCALTLAGCGAKSAEGAISEEISALISAEPAEAAAAPAECDGVGALKWGDSCDALTEQDILPETVQYDETVAGFPAALFSGYNSVGAFYHGYYVFYETEEQSGAEIFVGVRDYLLQTYGEPDETDSDATLENAIKGEESYMMRWSTHTSTGRDVKIQLRYGDNSSQIWSACHVTLSLFNPAASMAEIGSDEPTERGFSQAYLDCLSASALEAISQDAEAEFGSAVITVYDTQGRAASYAADSEELGAALDEAALVLALGTARGADGSVLVTYSYQWLQPPEERWADAIGVTWDSAYLEMEDNSFAKTDEYASDGKRVTASAEPTYATGAPSGVVWFAALPSGDADTLSGCGSFTLLPKQANFTVTLHACYAHALTADTLSLAITPDGPQKQGDAEIIAVDSVLTYTYD